MAFLPSGRVALAASVLCIILLHFGSATNASAAGRPATVIVLTDVDFHDAIVSHKHLLVAFHTRWCHHCRRLMPELEKVAEALAGEDPPVRTAKFDAANFREVSQLYGVIKFPTLLLFMDQTPREYTGPPTEAAILRGVKRLRAPAVARLEGDAEIDTFLERAAAAGSGVFLSVGADGGPFEEVAKEFKERMYFGEAHPSKERLLEWGVHRLPVVLSLHPPACGSDDVSGHTGPFDVVTLRRFVGLRRLPLIVPLGAATWPDVSNDSRPVVLVVLKEAGSAESEEFLGKVKPVARAYLESYLFAAVANKERAHFTRSFGIRSHTALPTIRVWNHQKRYWRIEDTPAFVDGHPDLELSLTELLDGVSDGTLKALPTRKVENPLEFIQDFVSRDGLPFAAGVLLFVVTAALRRGYFRKWSPFRRKSESTGEREGPTKGTKSRRVRKPEVPSKEKKDL